MHNLIIVVAIVVIVALLGYAVWSAVKPFKTKPSGSSTAGGSADGTDGKSSNQSPK